MSHLDGEIRILGCIADITGSGDVNAASDARPMDRCNDSLVAEFNGTHAVLKFLLGQNMQLQRLDDRIQFENEHGCYL